MSIFKPKGKTTVEQHINLSLYPIYKFDPTPDFIRISKEGLLTNQELERLKDEDHYLLTAQEVKRIHGLWGKGGIENLSKELPREEASERIGYWFGRSLPLIYRELSGSKTAMQKAGKALEAINYYLEEMDDTEGAKINIILTLAFVERVLGKDTGKDGLYGEKRFYVNYFAESLIKSTEKEFRRLPSKLLYESPAS